MKALLVCSVLAAASADPQLLLGGYGGVGLGYPYAVGSALTYTPHVIKPVVKEIEVPVKTISYGIKETGCKNFFGFSVPCLAEGEARRKRSADEAVEEKAAPVLTYAAGVPFGYGYGLGLGAYGYAGLGLPHAYAAPAVTVAEPTVTEVEVPQYVYKAVNEKVELAPLCHNGLGFAVPCA
eukprot:TRINITY_DN232_c2_g1_i12.p1 TRINITY_DN232_c2_g1~~TRINITY_DN232_c2_g1_i12.p1  ORF type:complete len:198 (-),score=89.12 TRINITY_DN232_c2_g1_i12:63-602(-)